MQPSPRKFADPAAAEGNSITPLLISETYSTHSAIVNRSGPNSQIAFSGDSFIATKALTKFFAEFPQSKLHRAGDADLFSYTTDGGSRAAPQDLNCEGDNPSEWCAGYGEPMLDVEWMMGTAPGVRTHLFRLNVPVDPPTEYILPVCPALLAFVNYLLKYPDAPYSASISYGLPSLCSDTQIEDMEIRFAKLALKGVSLMAASGDDGTYPAPGCNTSACTLRTVWPAASPWITAVGGTKLVKGTAGFGQEVWSGSGGGFSEYSSRKIAPWQEAAVSEYLAKLSSLPGAPPNSTFGAAGVGVPDVASFATEMATCPFPTACGSSGDGTSYASPTFAGIVSLLNEARLQANLPRMGFLNPFLYKHADAFTDITDGRNNDSSLLYGFPAAMGWDAATGLGTPNFEKLRAAALRSFS
jgi:tripeptidyl-peptidase-1